MANLQTRSIVVSYVDQRLNREGLAWPDRPVVDGDVDPDIHATMWRMTEEFENRFAEVFDELGDQLDFDAETANQTFEGIVGETFQEGISWSRIVALMCLSGALASKCVSLGMPQLVNDVVNWTVDYVDHHLSDWIRDHDGWNGFLRFYRNQDQVDGPGLGRVLGYAAGLVGVLTIGAFLGQRA